MLLVGSTGKDDRMLELSDSRKLIGILCVNIDLVRSIVGVFNNLLKNGNLCKPTNLTYGIL